MQDSDYTLKPKLKSGEEVVLKLKDIDRPIFVQASRLISDPDPMRAIECVLKGCTVEGDVDKVIADFKALKSCEGAVVEMMTIEQVELKKN